MKKRATKKQTGSRKKWEFKVGDLVRIKRRKDPEEYLSWAIGPVTQRWEVEGDLVYVVPTLARRAEQPPEEEDSIALFAKAFKASSLRLVTKQEREAYLSEGILEILPLPPGFKITEG